MSIFAKKDKQKSSVEFTKQNHAAIQEYADATGSTFGRITNYMVDFMLKMPYSVRNDMARFCSLKNEEICRVIRTLGDFERGNAECERSAYQRLTFFFSGTYNIPNFGNHEKKKASVEFTTDNHKLITEYAKRADSTFGRLINYMISLTFLLPQSVKDELAAYCASRTQELSNTIANVSEFERSNYEEERQSYQKVNFFFSFGNRSEPQETSKSRRIFLKNGYLTCPSDWIILSDALSQPDESTRAHVVEVRNGDKYGVPHFLFFSNICKERNRLSEEEENKVYDACIKVFPEFQKIMNQQVDPPNMPPTDPAYREASKKFLESPFIGIFNIVATDDPWYSETDNPPYGCVVVRNRKEKEN